MTGMRDARHNLRGSLFMTAAMAGFAIEDACLKLVAGALPVGQILILFGLFGMAVFAALARAAGEPAFPRALLTPTMAVRSVFEVAGRLFFMLALALTPVSTSSAILQAAPLIVVAGAGLIFGERISLRRWLAVAAGFCGVLLILRPGADFDLLSLLAVAATIGFAGRDLATRAAAPALSHRQLGVAGFLMLVIAGLIALPFGAAPVLPDPGPAAILLAAGLAGVAAYFALTVAMRTGEVGAVTPFRYTRLVFALAAGALVFGERPDAMTLAGAAVVVVAGILALGGGKAGAPAGK